jgi:hypothetical protein
LQQEQVRSGALQSELADARRELAAVSGRMDEEATQLRSTQGSVAELQQSLQQERGRSSLLQSALAHARRKLGVVARARDEQADQNKQSETARANLEHSLQKERERTGALEAALSDARTKLEAAASEKDGPTQLKQAAQATKSETSLEQEPDRPTALEAELTSVRGQFAAIMRAKEERSAQLNSSLTVLEELRQFSEHERARTFTLDAEIAGLRQTLAARSSLKDEIAMPIGSAGPAAVTSPPSLEQETGIAISMTEPTGARPQTAEPTTDPSGAVHTRPADSERASSDQSDRVRTGPNSEERPTPLILRNAEAASMVARANKLLAEGNIAAARAVLESVVEAGSAQASFALAETYDPKVLPRWGAVGTQADTAKALDLYSRAADGGIAEAHPRLRALSQ